VSCGKTAESIEMSFGMWTWIGQRNHALDGVQIHTRKSGILRGEVAGSGRVWTSLAVDILKVTQQGVEPVRCGCRLEFTRWDAHWRNLAYTSEPSVCGGDAALCQITLTTC